MNRLSIFGEKGRNYVFPKPLYVMGGTCIHQEQNHYSIEPIECKMGWKNGHQVLLPKGMKSDAAPKRKKVVVDTDGKVTITNEYSKIVGTRKLKLRPRKRIEV